jgi:hypothetical protein
MIAYEEEASEIRTFEPTLVTGLLQTEAYARAVIGIGREMNEDTIAQLVTARMQRQQVVTRSPATRHHRRDSANGGGRQSGDHARATVTPGEHGQPTNITIEVLRLVAESAKHIREEINEMA